MYKETVCEEIKEDMKNIVADSKKIDGSEQLSF